MVIFNTILWVIGIITFDIIIVISAVLLIAFLIRGCMELKTIKEIKEENKAKKNKDDAEKMKIWIVEEVLKEM